MTSPKDSSNKDKPAAEKEPQGGGGSSSANAPVAEEEGASTTVLPPRPQTGAGRGRPATPPRGTTAGGSGGSGSGSRAPPQVGGSEGGVSRTTGQVGGIVAGATGGGIAVGGEGAGGGAVAAVGASGSSGRRQKRKAELVAPQGVAPVCSVCQRDFGSWKALFGHMRSHPERQWRGAFPPPVEQRPAAAEGEQANPQQPAQEVEGASQARVGLDVDLNEPHGEGDQDVGGGFDLNLTPSSSSEDGGEE